MYETVERFEAFYPVFESFTSKDSDGLKSLSALHHKI